MYPITSAVKALFDAEQTQVLRITGTDKNNTSISITDANVVSNGFSVDRYSCNGQKLEIGTAIAGELSIRLVNSDGAFNGIVFEGAELFVEIGIADWSQTNPSITWIPCGYFTSDEQPRALNTITIHALDRMMRFDKEIDTTGLTLPATISGLVSWACTNCNVPFTQTISGLPNAAFSVSALPELQQGITYRDIIKWCAGIMGTNAWIDWEGKLQFSFYGAATGYVTTVANRFSSDLYEDDITVTGVQYTNTQGVTLISGTAEYALDMTGNYLAASGVAEILGNINTAINGFTYRPFEATVINAPYLWPMDMITFSDRGGTNHTCAVTNVNFKINSTTILRGKGETSQINAGANPSPMTSEQAFLVEKAKESTISDIDASLTQQDIFNRLTDNGALQGLYMLNGELYVNASYIQSGTMSADRINGGILTLGGANNVNGQMQVLDANGNVVGTWDNTGIKVESADGDSRASVTDGRVSLMGYLIPDWSNVPQWLHVIQLYAGLHPDGTLANATGYISGNASLVIRGNQKPVTLEYSDHTVNPYISVRLGVEAGNGDGQYTISHPDRFRKALGIGNSTGAFPIPVEQGGTGATNAAAARTNLGAITLSDVIVASGEKQFGSLAAGATDHDTINMGVTISDKKYMVLTEPLTGNVTAGIQNKDYGTFDLWVRNVSTGSATGTVRWAVIRLS